MTKTLKVILWGDEVGRLAWDESRQLSYFMYNPDFVKKGIDIFPLVAPISGVHALTPVWGEGGEMYQKLSAFLVDLLPDIWERQQFEQWREQHDLAESDVTPLDLLAFVGRRGMGALEFKPELFREPKAVKIDVDALQEMASRQSKALVAIHRRNGTVRSGYVMGLEGYDYYILKFGNAECCSAELEMAYCEMAVCAGIRMMPSRLFPIDGKNHFLTQRFDRDDDQKLHVQSLAAICPGADSYEQLLLVCRKLHLPEVDCQEVFRRMVFNILANNANDDSRKFSFVMGENGSWRLSPAYDMTYALDADGLHPKENHSLKIGGKFQNITRDDFIRLARENGIRRPDAIIRDVTESLRQFRAIATKYGVSEQWTGRVETTIIDHLKR